jgi:hypothetical protein
MPSGDPIWTDPIAFEKAVDEYFENETSPKWSGLALHLGFASRQSLWEYGQKPQFSLPIKKALLRIEQQYEDHLLSKNATGAIFALKNFGWKDKQEVEQKTEHSGGISISWEEPKLSDSKDQGQS